MNIDKNNFESPLINRGRTCPKCQATFKTTKMQCPYCKTSFIKQSSYDQD